MTPAEAKKVVDAIKDAQWDDEHAHSLEDRLHRDFIQHIVNLKICGLSDTARIILTTKDIEFNRWCT